MHIAWNAFTPVHALAGGALIGLAAVLLMLLNGRIAGISGILAGLFRLSEPDRMWRGAFVGGLLLAPALYAAAGGASAIELATAPGTLVAAGFLVGIGTRYGGGCTSGHGVCGLSRWSSRSLVATAAFMSSGFLTVGVVQHLLAG